MVLVRTSEKAGTCFIRTDQLDGETDWKLRLAVPSTQRLTSDMVEHQSVMRVLSDELVIFNHLIVYGRMSC